MYSELQLPCLLRGKVEAYINAKLFFMPNGKTQGSYNTLLLSG